MKSIAGHLRKIFAIGAAVALGACAAAPAGKPADARRQLAERARPGQELAVLFVGNSYSFGVPKVFARLASQRGKNVKVSQVTHSGWTLSRHAGNRQSLREIRGGPWDVIVFQEQSRLPSLPGWRSILMFPNVRKLADEARKQGVVPVLYQTWGYREGDGRHPGDDFQAMTRRIREGCQAAALDAGGLPVVAAGDAWEREVAAGRGAGLFMPDGSHPTPLGNSLTAEAFYEAFFGE